MGATAAWAISSRRATAWVLPLRRVAACADPPRMMAAMASPRRMAARLAPPPPPPRWLPFSPSSGSVGLPLSPEQQGGGGACGTVVAVPLSPFATRSSSLVPSDSHRIGAVSPPPGLIAHKRALRDEVRVKAAAGGVFPFLLVSGAWTARRTYGIGKP
jgi:hypothetical protein